MTSLPLTAFLTFQMRFFGRLLYRVTAEDAPHILLQSFDATWIPLSGKMMTRNPSLRNAVIIVLIENSVSDLVIKYTSDYSLKA